MAKSTEVEKQDGIGILLSLQVQDAVGVEERRVDDSTLLDGFTFHDAAALFTPDEVVSSETAMPSLDVLNGDDKARLVDVPFFAIDWTFRHGEQGNYVSIRAITEKNEVYLINDGSTGIYQQMLGYSEKTGKFEGLFCRKGLRRSDYKYTGEDGVERPATTFYIG